MAMIEPFIGKPGSAHSIVNYIPHDNFVAMINAFHKFWVY